MEFLTEEDIIKLMNKSEENYKYYKGRWEYFGELINEIKKMGDIGKTLELGPYKTPVVVGGDIIDISAAYINEYPIAYGKFIKHNCRLVPYPVKDKEYDLIIASQVLEHLGIYGEQRDIFEEFKRISNRAIITLPFEWFAPKSRDHHMITKKVITYWTGDYKPSVEIVTGDEFKRILLVYDFN